MIKRNLFTALLILACFCFSSTLVNAQSPNWLYDPFADANTDDWTAVDDATIEDINGNPSFVVRNGGYFSQEIPLPDDLSGEFMLIIGLVSSERINANGDITGLPYLYAYEMGTMQQNGSNEPRIRKYLNLSDVLHSNNDVNEWFVIWDIFPVPEHTATIQLFLKQAEQRGVPHNGSAARFDDLGVYFFTSVDEAESFVNAHYF
jgi:hypothetical protein